MSIDLLPIIQKACQSVLNSIRSTNLHYGIQETPFSIHITVRKSLKKSSIVSEQESPKVNDSVSQEMTKLNSRCTFLEQANEALKLDYEAEVNESESLKKHVAELKVNFHKLFEQKKE